MVIDTDQDQYSGSWISDPIINELLFGRRGAIFLSASLIFVCSIGSAFVSHPWQLLIWRIFLGVGMGCKAAVVPVFAAEIAPGHLRGECRELDLTFDFLTVLADLGARLTGNELADIRFSRHISRVLRKSGCFHRKYVNASPRICCNTN